MAQILDGAGPETRLPVRRIDGLLDADDGLLGDYKLGLEPPGNPLVVTYSFASPASPWSVEYPAQILADTAVELTPAQQDATRTALAAWSRIADITFVEVQETAESVGVIRLARSEVATGAFTFVIRGGAAYGADIWFGTDFPAAADLLQPGSYGYMGFVHEIGHALGLKHPHEPPRVLPFDEDWLGASLMSYRTFPGQPTDDLLTAETFPDGPMAMDIEAIRFLYGKRAVAIGNDVYLFEPGERIFTTLVDEGGNDLLDWSNQTVAATIDLRMGAWSLLGEPFSWQAGFFSDAGSFPGSLRLAPGTVIEAAFGGQGDDRIIGNAAANVLAGRAGDDVIVGGDGNDRLDGGSGDDLLLGQNGDDRILGLGGSDHLQGGNGADQINGGTLDDILDGGAGADDLFGGDGDDRMGGGGGADRIHGGNGRDVLAGGHGGDQLGGGAGDDLLNGGPGSDFLTGGTGRDRFVLEPDAGSTDRLTDFRPGIDQILLRGGYTAGQFLAAGRSSGGSTLFELDGGHDVLVVGAAGARIDWFVG
ncbi:M10 family metallopeptidase C-terminal domain-containing protein [Geminicoccus roseus]|uniref:M10 family metallopeptidase C-terminal domain-containing protein n=1 Tax=Geminicoccus roseus TaxID=404900 RepID=UPI000482CDE2|nr:M10 family metallopeptidase C-terminal domain-containing protein [Geminicoccus roseus]